MYISEETKKKMSLAHKGKISPMKGRHLSKETKLKISNSVKNHHSVKENKIKMSMSAKGRKHTIETKNKIKENNARYWLGKHISEETRKKLIIANIGKHISKEIRLKMSKSQKERNPSEIRTKICPKCNLPFVYKQKDQIYCSKKCFDKYCPIEKIKVCIVCHKLFTCKYKSQSSKYCSEDCAKKGFSIVAHNKRYSEKTKLKISQSRMGMNNPNYGKHPSEETRLKLSLCHRKERSYAWNGGSSSELYPFEFNHKLKELIRERDGYICQMCHIGQNGKLLDIHHIDYNKYNLNQNNLISLCHTCHMKTNTSNREYYTEYFSNLLNIN